MLVADVIQVLALITHSITGTGTGAYNRDVLALPCPRRKQYRRKKTLLSSSLLFENQGKLHL